MSFYGLPFSIILTSPATSPRKQHQEEYLLADNLTDSLIRGLKPLDAAHYVWDKSGERGAGRLGVKVEPSGQRIFYYRYYWQAQRQFILLGRYPEMSLAQARQHVSIPVLSWVIMAANVAEIGWKTTVKYNRIANKDDRI